MANENEKNPSALEELRRLKRTDRIKSLDIHEPELHDFNAENIFHIDEEPEKKTIFGKRSARTHVKINENIFDDEVAESVDITPSTSIEEVEAPIEKHVVEEPKVDDKPLVEEKTKFIEEEPKVVEEPEKIVVEKLDVDDDFTTESIENELKSFNAKPIEEEQPAQEVLDDEDDFEDEYVDDDEGEDEDLYEERKKFLYAEYPKIEQYLQDKSSEGYHFVRQEGKKYFFRKGQPKTYYYSMNYFVDEPDADQWREWESDGWKLVSKSDGKKKSDAGWFTFRNEEEDGEYRRQEHQRHAYPGETSGKRPRIEPAPVGTGGTHGRRRCRAGDCRYEERRESGRSDCRPERKDSGHTGKCVAGRCADCVLLRPRGPGRPGGTDGAA